MEKPTMALFALLRDSLCRGCSDDEKDSLSELTKADWDDVVDKAFEQGVAALIVDALQKSDTNALLESEELEDLRYELFGEALACEDDYSSKYKSASRYASALKEKGVECRVLKGLSFATYYEHPGHREFGDCDVYLGEGWAVGNEVAVSLGGRFDQGTRKHSHLFLDELMIENHRYITNAGWTRRRRGVEELLRKRLEEGPVSPICLAGLRGSVSSDLLCPSNHFNALFLLIHAVGNFTSSGMSLRMVYDWAALMKCCQNSLDWRMLYEDMELCGVRTFADVMTSICVEHLGLEITNPSVTVCDNRELVDEVLRDVVEKGVFASPEGTFFQKVLKIFRRFGRYRHYRMFLADRWWKVVAYSLLDNVRKVV